MNAKIAWQRSVLALMQRMERRVQRLPRARALREGAALGRFAHAIAARPRRHADRNLRLAYGDSLSDTQRRALIRAVFEHFGKMAVDFLRMPLLDSPDAMHRLVTTSPGWEQYARPALDKGSVIFLSGHVGNFELLARWLAFQGITLTVVARDPEEEAFRAYIRRMREDAGFAVTSKGSSVKTLLQALRRGESLGIMPDQNAGDVFAPFFGVPAGTVSGPATLALRTGATLLPCFCLLQPDGTYRIDVHPPIDATPSGEGTRESDTLRIMTDVNRTLESVVRAHPEQWLWLHNRWKAAFEEKNRARWPADIPFDPIFARWAAAS